MSDSPNAPEYQDLFPGLTLPAGFTKSHDKKQTELNRIQSSTVTDGLSISVEEQKFADEKPAFGGRPTKQADKIAYITESTGAKILVSTSSDKTLTFIISGKASSVKHAKNELMKHLQKEASVTFQIPQEHHRIIIGKGGSKLKEIQSETGTFIKLNKGEDDIRINGNSAGVRKARMIIEAMSAEEAKRDRVTLEVVQAYHPLIAGHKKATINRIKEETGVAIHMPPRDKEVDEITITGETQAVARAAAELMAIYEEKRRTCGELTARVPKHKHKYVIGPKGVNLDEIMERFQVVVDIPPADSEEDMLVLRGNQSSLVHALTCVYEKADSVIEDSVRIPNWLHRHIIGKKGVGVKKLTEDSPQLSIDFPDEGPTNEDVALSGPPEQVATCKAKLYALVAELLGRLSFTDLKVDPKHFPQLIGKKGAVVLKIKQATDVQIDFAEKGDPNGDNGIHIEGTPAGVAEAKRQILDLVIKLENQRTAVLEVEHRYHSLLIGEGGKKIKAILAATPDVTVDFPSKGDSSNNTITLKGPANAVALAEFSMKSSISTIELENFFVEVAIFKAFHKNVIGQKGAVINGIKDATNCRIDVPDAGDASDVITVTGIKANCIKAQAMILKVQEDIAVIVEESVAIDKGALKQIKGKVTAYVVKACGGVIVTENGVGYAVKGPDEAVAKAKGMFEKFAGVIKDGGEAETISVPAKHHRYIIGRDQAGLKALQDANDVVIIFPANNSREKGAAADSVQIWGKRTAVGVAKAAIAARVTAIEDVAEDTIDVEKPMHKHFFLRKGEFLEKLRGECGGVNVKIPKDGSTAIKLKGGKIDVATAKAMIAQYIADIKAKVTLEVVIASKFHRRLIGPGVEKIRAVQEEFNVQVKFPDSKGKGGKGGNGRKPGVQLKSKAAPAAAAAAAADADADGGDAATPAVVEAAPVVNRADIVKVSGTEPNCKAAIAALEAAVPQNKLMDIDPDLHRFIIGSRGEGIRKLMEQYDVFVKFPNADSGKSEVRVEGSSAALAEFTPVIETLIAELEATKAERELKSFKVTVEVEPQFHQKLIGKGGAVITAFREEHDVQVDFPNRKKKLSDEAAKKVVITGLQANAEAAGAAMTKSAAKFAGIKTLVLNLLSGCHRKIIGKSGAKIKQLQEKHDVRIMLPRDGGDEVLIEGSEEGCLDCQEDLLDIEEEWEQEEKEWADKRGEKAGEGGEGEKIDSSLSMYVKPRYAEQQRAKASTATKPTFNMSNAPWQGGGGAAKSFPGLGGKAEGAHPVVAGPWGGKRK